jgi:hypothetical protein
MDYRASFSLNRRAFAFFGARAIVPCDSGMKKIAVQIPPGFR